MAFHPLDRRLHRAEPVARFGPSCRSFSNERCWRISSSHAAAMVTMGLILMAALPGGPTKDDAVRVAFIASIPGCGGFD